LPSLREGAVNAEEKANEVNDFYKISKSKPFENVMAGYLIKSKKYQQKIDWIASIGSEFIFTVKKRKN
jgi:hypothetical protein